MELGSEEIVLPHHRTELASVITLQCDDGGIGGSHVEAVNKVEMAVFCCVGKDGCSGSLRDRIPAHVGNFIAWGQIEPHDIPCQNTKSLVFAMFESTLKQEL